VSLFGDGSGREKGADGNNLKDERPQPNAEGLTGHLHRWNAGDKTAANEIVQAVYDELRRIAAAYARRERPDHTLQATAIVHEAYLRIFKNEEMQWRDRAHFLGAASRVMREVLIDYARQRSRSKRRPEGGYVPMAEDLGASGGSSVEDVLAVDESLQRLAEVDARKARVLEAYFFGGLTVEETADYLGISRTTAVRELKLAKGWVYQNLASRRDVG